MRPQQESNLQLLFRRELVYPLAYGGLQEGRKVPSFAFASRLHDSTHPPFHNTFVPHSPPVLCQGLLGMAVFPFRALGGIRTRIQLPSGDST